MFGGSFAHNLDSAGRFVMPKKFRLNLGEEFVITRGLGCLCVFTKDFVDKKLSAELEQLGSPLQSLLNPDIVRLTRHFFMDMAVTGSDAQNRVPLTSEHRRFAGIEDDVVICGCGGYIELWSPGALAEYRKKNDAVDIIIASGDRLLANVGRRAPGEADAGVSQAGPA
jgi:MraZ protein